MSTPQNVERKIKQNALTKGLILGIILTALSLFSFYFIIGFTRAPLLIIVTLFSCSTLVPVIFSIFFCIDMRKKIGGYWSLRQAVTGIFFMFFIAYATLTIGRDFIFVKLIEPGMPKKVEAVMIGVKENRLKAQGAPDDVIKSQISELKKELDTPANISVLDIVNGYFKTIILLFAIAVVFAAVFKKEPPLVVRETVIIEE